MHYSFSKMLLLIWCINIWPLRKRGKKVFCSFKSFCINYFENSTVRVVILLSFLILWEDYAFENQNKNSLTAYRLSLKVTSHFLETVLSNSSWPCHVSIGLNQGLANIINESLLKAQCLNYWHLPHLVLSEGRQVSEHLTQRITLDGWKIWE